MPELPEVETIKTGLSKLIIGLKVKSVEFDWDKSFPNSKNDTAKFLVNAKIVQVRRRAKVLIIDLNTKYSLIIHLKMTGQLVFRSKAAVFGAGHPNNSLVGVLPDRSTRVIFYLEKGRGAAREPNARKQRSTERSVQPVKRLSTEATDNAALFFNDQRKFGWVRLVPTIEIPNIDFFASVGPEPLSSEFKDHDFIDRFVRRPNSKIKAALLDQTVIAGVGNIYADESLWGAKIHPRTQVKNLSDSDLRILFKKLQYVLRLSIEKGGSTDRNYVDAKGQKGSYLSFANVFRRQGLPCSRCNTTIEKIRVAGRGTHICPVCQKEVVT